MPDDASTPKPRRPRPSRAAAKPRTLGKTGRGNPYIWWRPGRVDADGVDRTGRWWIVHKGKQVRSTGCGHGKDAERQALEALDEYTATLAVVAPDASGPRKNRPACDVLVAEVLDRYLSAKKGRTDPVTGEVKGGVARHHELAQRVETLLEWWGERSLEDVDSVSCAAYVDSRVGSAWKAHARAGLDRDGNARADGAGPVRRGHSRPAKPRTVSEGGARRELEDLRAAVNLALTDGLTREVVKVTLPAKSEARDRWLTKPEAARLLLAAWRKRETQTVHRGERKGEQVKGRRVGKHLARHILVGLRTGTRSGPVCGASFIPEVGRPWMELRIEDGKRVALFHRKALGAAAKKNKRQPTVRMPDSLVAHLWRWHHVLGQRYVVEWNGKPVGSTKRAFANLVHELGLGDDVVRHSLRHTAVTWGMQEGVDIWELAGYVGMSVEMIERRYGHHASDHMEGARAALGGRGRKRAA
ncbi:site-specific integrase [Methylobacterium sp. WL64]|uniref:site-specific integrase n=1 Tax=Methylobacterium sp. WL64 TaxID=2603894 RepID=UPI0011CBCFEE|nr:site-specific integrase [Methylobacterium sp. WL64]TXM98807.1 site-specific integrase [Methylobacterium sp. WL64]